MKSNSAFQRLQAEYRRLAKDPIQYLTAQPLSSNLLEWRYVVRGPSETPYEGGIYQGKIVFPFDYPYKPPSKYLFINKIFSSILFLGIYMLTPNGRFKTNTSLCLTITSFHPDSWNPSW
jgi:ubiquitin-conjugating enzyme E2 J2